MDQLVDSRFRRPTPLPHAVLGPPSATRRQVLPLGDQPWVQLAGEQRDAVRFRVVTKEVAGEADLAAAAGHQHLLVEVRPLLYGDCQER
jgi:hypothetical protein